MDEMVAYYFDVTKYPQHRSIGRGRFLVDPVASSAAAVVVVAAAAAVPAPASASASAPGGEKRGCARCERGAHVAHTCGREHLPRNHRGGAAAAAVADADAAARVAAAPAATAADAIATAATVEPDAATAADAAATDSDAADAAATAKEAGEGTAAASDDAAADSDASEGDEDSPGASLSFCEWSSVYEVRRAVFFYMPVQRAASFLQWAVDVKAWRLVTEMLLVEGHVYRMTSL